MAALTEAVASLRDERDLFEYMRLTKQAVVASVEAMDRYVKIHDTGHFNHSAYPDLVLTWNNKAERSLYVRRSFDELEAGHDVERLAQTAPVFLSLGPTETQTREATERRVGVDREGSERVLVTDAATFDVLTNNTAPDQDSPLAGVVASQILPAGRGLLDQQRAESVINPSADILANLEVVLSAEALHTVSEIASLVAAASGGVVPRADEDTQPFTLAEAKDLLPWLLRSQTIAPSDEFWIYLASRLTLKHLEAVAEDLHDVELSRICGPGWTQWHALRAALTAKVIDLDAPVADGWYLRGKLLTYEVGDAAMKFASYGQALKERDSLSSASWERIEPNLGDASVQNVLLRGIVRSIRIDARSSTDVTDDIRSIQTSVEDRYYVDQLTVRYGLAAEDRTIRIDLGGQLAQNEGSATVRDMALALANIAAYRNPVDLSSMT